MNKQERHDIAMVLNYVAVSQSNSKTIKDYESDLAFINYQLQQILHGGKKK